MLKEGSVEFLCTVHNDLLSFNMPPVALGPCLGIHQTMALIGDAKQAIGEEKSGPIKTRLITLAATDLV